MYTRLRSEDFKSSASIHGCCQRNRPLKTKHGADGGSASAPRACHSAHRRVRPIGGTISRHFGMFSCSCAATLLLGRGQQLRTAGARRWEGARFAPFCRCSWLHQVPLGGRRARARVVVGDARARLASRVSGSFGVTCRCRSFVTTHTSMIDVADFSVFPLLQTPSYTAKPVVAMAVECAAKAKAFVLEQSSAEPIRTDVLTLQSHHPAVADGRSCILMNSFSSSSDCDDCAELSANLRQS